MQSQLDDSGCIHLSADHSERLRALQAQGWVIELDMIEHIEELGCEGCTEALDLQLAGKRHVHIPTCLPSQLPSVAERSYILAEQDWTEGAEDGSWIRKQIQASAS